MLISLGNFDPVEVPQNWPAEEKKLEFKPICMKDKKKKVYNMIEKKKLDLKENRDPMEVKVMNTRSGRRYVKNSEEGEQIPENLATTEDHVAKESHSFRYNFIDHLS